jgi:hypothetical protein
MADTLGLPVLAGLALGIVFIVLFASFFNQSQSIFSSAPFTSHPEPGRFREEAVKIALQNTTLQEEFSGSEAVVTSYRDWGVGHLYYDCPMDWCAHITFADKSDPGKIVAVLVNMKSSQVLEIRASRDLLVSKTNGTEEAKLFLSKYPDAEISVNPKPGYSVVTYEAATTTRSISLLVKTSPIGEVQEMSAECWRDGSKVRVTGEVLSFIETSDCVS